MPAASEMSSRAFLPSSDVGPEAQDPDRHDRDDRERRDAREQVVVEAQALEVAATRAERGHQPGDAAEQQRVSQDRAGDRDAHDVGEVRAQRQERQRELRDVAERRLHDAEHARREPAAKAVAAHRDQRCDQDERQRARVGAGGVADREVHDARHHGQRHRRRQRRPLAVHQTGSPLNVATSASAIARIGRPVRCDARRMRL